MTVKAKRATHDDNVAHECGQLRTQLKRVREIRHAAHRDDRQLMRVLPRKVNDSLRPRGRVGAADRIGKVDVAEAVLAMHEVRVLRGQTWRECPAAPANTGAGIANDFFQMQRIARRIAEARIAKAGDDTEQIDVWRVVQKQQRHRIVDADVCIENYFMHHGGSLLIRAIAQMFAQEMQNNAG